MAELALTAELEAAFHTLDDLAAQSRRAEAYDRALERTAYLLRQLQELHAELRALRRCAEIAAQRDGEIPETTLWRQTTDEIGPQLPPALQSLDQAIEHGDAGLLDLVASLAAATALVRERRARLIAALQPALRTLPDNTVDLAAADAPAVLATLELLDRPSGGPRSI